MILWIGRLFLLAVSYIVKCDHTISWYHALGVVLVYTIRVERIENNSHPTETYPPSHIDPTCQAGPPKMWWRNRMLTKKTDARKCFSPFRLFFCHCELPLPARRTHRGNHVHNHVLLPSWRCCFLSKQGNHAHARKHTFPCGGVVSFPNKRLCLSLWCYCFLSN
jgi:hypothetical protein